MITSSLLALTALVAAPAADAPFQDLALDQAFAAAKKDGKIVMIDFFTTWCAPCKRLDKLTWPDKDVQEWVAKTAVAIKLDAEKEVEIAKRYHVESYPTILFLKNDGSEIDRIIAFKQPAEFLDEAKSLIAGKGAVERIKAKMSGGDVGAMEREEMANALAGKGKYEEALTQYLWCFDHGAEHDASYAGVRLSFLVSEIGELGTRYPPAKKALEERRDAAETALFSEKGAPANAAELFALNDALKASDRNVAAWERLTKEKRYDSSMRLVVWRHVVAPLVQKQRYADAVAAGGDLEGKARWEIQMAKAMPQLGKAVAKSRESNDVDLDEIAATTGVHLTVSEVGRYYEAAVGAHQAKMADGIAQQLIAFSPTYPTYVELIDRATRAGDLDAARAMAERGIAAVPEKERAILQDALKRIPENK
jgi:thiol-disulfide isomerase/thioredoxin